MAEIGLAASIIAVIQLSGKIISLCSEYSHGVKDAQNDIQRLKRELESLEQVLKQLDILLNNSNAAKLVATQSLRTTVNDCLSSLGALDKRLRISTGGKLTNKLRFRDLKWPFESKEVEKLIAELGRYKQTFSLALEVDQTTVILETNQTTLDTQRDVHDVNQNVLDVRQSVFDTHQQLLNTGRSVEDVHLNVLDIRQATLDTQQSISDVHVKVVDIREDVLKTHRKLILAQLPVAEGAAFDSHVDEHEALCHANTRIDLLRQIQEWGRDPQGKAIFWLNGMAGTGKSTISRTIAQTFAREEELASSFFFKRGEGDRGHAARFFTTIAAQLAVNVPILCPVISAAVDENPAISGKTMKEQFEKLIIQPLSKIAGNSQLGNRKLFIVVDALDECEREDDIKTILHLFSQAQPLGTILRIFVTSRPDLPIRLGFAMMSDGSYQDLVLHEIPSHTIEQDISTFLRYQLENIKNERNRLHRSNPSRQLPSDWPSDADIQTLASMAIPLFIFAATVCRFIGDPRWDPKDQLSTVLKYDMKAAKALDRTYLPILDQLVHGDLADSQKNDLTAGFRKIIGSIVLLEEPLPAAALASLLGVDETRVDCILDPLHSVLNVPTNPSSPVRILHQSFRDFIVDPEKRGKSEFWINENETHHAIAMSCLDRLSQPGVLKQNMCNLSGPGSSRTDIDSQSLERFLPVEVQYASRYWVGHLERSGTPITDKGPVFQFLRKNFLCWFEALAMMGRVDEGISMIISLQELRGRFSDFLYDARRFILRNRRVINIAPLQLYSSALIFAPKTSIIRQYFRDHIPSWITGLPKVETDWSPSLLLLEGHSIEVEDVTFSPDGKLIASASWDGLIRLWDTATGATLKILEGHTSAIRAVAFSPCSKLVASASLDGSVRVWDSATGAAVRVLEGHLGQVNAITFSPDGKFVVSGSTDRTVIAWELDSTSYFKFEGHSGVVHGVAFSPDGTLIASASRDHTIRFWDTTSGETVRILEGHRNVVHAVAFSPDGKSLASGSWDDTVKIWDVDTGNTIQTFKANFFSSSVTSVAFSPDGKLIAAATAQDETIKLWDVTKETSMRIFRAHRSGVTKAVFSPDRKQLVSSSLDETVRLCDLATVLSMKVPEEDFSECMGPIDLSPDGKVGPVEFSPDGKLVATASRYTGSAIKLWDTATGSIIMTFLDHFVSIYPIKFSPDGKLIATGSPDNTIPLWNTATGIVETKLKGHSGPVNGIEFSTDGKSLTSVAGDGTIRQWNTTTGANVSTETIDDSGVFLFGPDCKLIAYGQRDSVVGLFDSSPNSRLLESSPNLRLLEGINWPQLSAFAFSPDTKFVASALKNGTVTVWDASTGEAVRTHKLKKSVRQLYFSSDGSYLETERGLLSTQTSPTAPPLTADLCNVFV